MLGLKAMARKKAVGITLMDSYKTDLGAHALITKRLIGLVEGPIETA